MRVLSPLATFAGHVTRTLPGLAAAGCGAAGSYLLWGLGVALLVTAGFMLLLAVELNR